MQRENRRRDICPHDVYIKGLCGKCGIRLDPPQSNSVSMIHSVPELKVSEEYAKKVGKDDQERLINERKLVLLIDLDQTILHTTHDRVKDQPPVHSFVLWPGHPTYYTKLRPHLEEFLDRMSKIYELHIFTFGCRLYANKIASIIDPDQKYFGTRILSRDESVDQYSKQGNLNNLFPCGDAMVCIIDDRADVWRDAGNLIQVKPYSYFKNSISDGALLNMTPHVEDDGSLDSEVDQLEALLNEGEEDELDDEEGKLDDDDKSGERLTGAAESNNGEEETKVERSPASQPIQEARSDLEKTKESVSSDMPSKETPKDLEPQSPNSPPADDDPDDHLLHLPTILSRIHEKWYMELDEQRQFLVDGERYKLPDIKDIIKRYLRKRYN